MLICTRKLFCLRIGFGVLTTLHDTFFIVKKGMGFHGLDADFQNISKPYVAAKPEA